MDPGSKSANARLRAWRAALESDPQAEPSEEAGAKLLADEAAVIAKREAEEAAVNAKYQAEVQAQRAASQAENKAKNDQYERKYFGGHPQQIQSNIL